MKRAATVALTGFLMLSLGAGIAQAEPYSDPATTPGKIVVHPKPQPLIQPPIEATVYAQPYGLVPDFHAASNFSPLGTQKNIRVRGPLLQPNRYSLFFKTRAACQADLDPYGHDYGALNPIVPQHWLWMAKNDAPSKSARSATRSTTACGSTNTTTSSRCRSCRTHKTSPAITPRTSPQNRRSICGSN